MWFFIIKSITGSILGSATSKWFSMIKEKENYKKAILNWNNDDYLNLMSLRGKESIKKIKKIISKT